MNCVLDLDGTIVFAEPAEIAIPGRSRCSYISAATAHWLERIGDLCSLYIASARNADSVAGLVRALPQVRFAGFVLEGGLVHRVDVFGQPNRSPAQVELSDAIASEHPDWELVKGYEQMICCIASSPSDSLECVRRIALSRASTIAWKSHRERHKTFFYPSPLCKLAGLRQLGVKDINFAAGDDEIYDATFMADAERCYAPRSASPGIIQLVQERRGTLVASPSHRGAVEILEQIHRHMSANGQKKSVLPMPDSRLR